MQVGDLIRLRELQPIIQLGNEDDQDEVRRSFVWTNELKVQMKDFAKRLSLNEGGGVFLKGHYGTGKSHLLSFLNIHAHDWYVLSHQFEVSVNKGHLAIPISLIQWTAEHSLEEIVFKESQKWIPEWNEGASDNRLEQYNDLCGLLNNQGYAGFILLFDELSEFLKSKDDPSRLAEDIRYLQFLAEFGREQQSWIIAAIQEDIEGIGSASRETSLKLKDRYALRWNLGSGHIEQMLSERLVEHRPGSDSQLAELFFNKQKQWPNLFSKLESFSQIYPLHPGTLDLLMGLGTLFSEHRGALRFMQEVLDGSWRPGEEPFLNQEIGTLIGPNLLFDYFSERFSENLELNEYYHKAYIHLLSRIKTLIPVTDQALGKACLKVVVLCTLDPRKEGVTLQELTGLVQFSLGSSQDLAEEYIENNIFGLLKDRVNYLREKHGRIHIDLGHESYELLGRILEEKVQNINLKQNQAWNTLMTMLDRRPLDLVNYWDSPDRLGPIPWLNSLRQLQLSWSQSDHAADIIILLPGEKLEKVDDDTIYFHPREANEEEAQVLLFAAALYELLSEPATTIVEKQAREEAKKRRQAELPTWRQLIEKLYREGRWTLGSKVLDLNIQWSRINNFESLLEDPVYELLSQRHPMFRLVAPKIPFLNERMLTDIIDVFVRPGEASEAELNRARIKDTMIGVMKPLGLMEKTKGLYRFIWDGSVSPLVRIFEQSLVASSNLAAVKKNLIEGEYGLTESLTHFMLWCGVTGGIFRAIRDDEEIPETKLSFHNLHTIEHLEREETINETQARLLQCNAFFANADFSYSGLTLQRHLWQYAQNRIKPVAKWLEDWQSHPPSQAWGFINESYQLYADRLERIPLGIQDESSSSKQGLEAILSQLDELTKINEALDWGKAFYQNYGKYRERMDALWLYLSDEFLSSLENNEAWGNTMKQWQDLDNRLKALRSSNDPWVFIEPWLVDVEDWINGYCGMYKQEHESFYKRHKPSAAKSKFIDRIHQAGLKLCEQTKELRCERNLNLELKTKPFCRCGFQGDQEEEEGAANESYDAFFTSIRRMPYGIDEDTEDALRYCIDQQQWDKALELWEAIEKNKQQIKQRKIHWQELKRQWSGRSWTRETLHEEVDRMFDQNEGPVQFED